MSSSIKRSSNVEPEDTDEMMAEPLTRTERDNEYTASDSEENEETDERTNRYQFDGFVVPDDELEDETDEIGGTETESKRKRRKRRIKRDTDFSLEQDDIDIIKQNTGTSTDKHTRLRKNRRHDTTEDDEDNDQEDISISSSAKDNKVQAYNDSILNKIFHDGTENEEGMMDEEDDMVPIKKTELTQYFDPEEIEERFQTPQDRAIVEKDEPERLQLRFAKRGVPDNPELIEETNWLVEKIILKNNLQAKDTANLKNKVHKVLEFLRLANCEIMYIWVHKKPEFVGEKKSNFDEKGGEYELKLSDLWYIYDLDLEWMQIYQRRKHISALLSKLDTYATVSSNVKNSFRSCYDLTILNFFMNFVEYQLRKHVDDSEITQILMGDQNDPETSDPKFKRMKKRNFAKDVMKYSLHEIAARISITPDQLAENLLHNEQKFKPAQLNEAPDKIATEYTNTSVQFISSPVDTLTTLCEFMALEMFHHPLIKKELKKLYNEKVAIDTDPTDKGKKDIHVYNFYYPVKRIRGLKPIAFSKDLWLMVLEAEQKGLINIKFKLPWQKDEKEEKDEIRKKLLSLYLLENKARKSEGEEIGLVKAWNIVREEAVSKLLKNFIYPSMEKALREELRENAEKFVVSECAKYFRDTINIQPYKKSKEDGEFSNEQSKLKVLSCISEPATSKCYFVMADENGELLEYIVLEYIGRNPGEDPSLKVIYNNEKATLKALMTKIFPDVIVVGATNLNCQQIKLELDQIANEVHEDLVQKNVAQNITKPFVMWGISSIPNAWSKCHQARKRYSELPQELREALSLCRIVQDPLVETLNLWSDRLKDNVLLDLNYHVMQHMVSKSKLRSEFEKIAMEVCNNVGVEINRAVKYRHLASPLQFICGLGPRKAAYVLDKITHEIGVIRMRRELHDTVLGKTVFTNCIGFLKISEEVLGNEEEGGVRIYDRLDITRIHPDYYQIAVKISKEAFEDHSGNERVDFVRRVMENPKHLNELDLDDYAKHLNQKGKTNTQPLIEFIVQELTSPFQDPRAEFKTRLRSEDLFYKLTKESKFNLREEAIITVRITRIDSKAVRVVTDSGVPGIIPCLDLKDKVSDLKENEISKYYSVGEYLKAKVRSINYNLVRLKLSTKPAELADHKTFMRQSRVLENYNLTENNTFDVDATTDFPVLVKDREMKQTKYALRRINHPKFKNMPLGAAIDYLNSREIGDFVIRPSGQGNDHLNITWKLSGENVVHLDIKEGFKGEGDTISKHLTLDKEMYESLDEIIERYIKPCNHLINQIRDHKKFLEATLEYVKETLVEEKKNDPNVIPYYMNFISEAPQYLILSYIPRHFEVMHEYIKIKPDGLVFHEQKFGQLKRLITWFKSMLKTPEYQKYLEHTVPPSFDLNKKNRDLRVKEEFNVKKEGRDPKREKKREKDSVYKQRPTDHVKRRRTGSDEENRYSSRGSQPWGENGWNENNDNQRDWNPDWDPKQSRGRGSSLSNFSQERGRQRQKQVQKSVSREKIETRHHEQQKRRQEECCIQGILQL